MGTVWYVCIGLWERHGMCESALKLMHAWQPDTARTVEIKSAEVTQEPRIGAL
jgi:hypothetical protein